MAKLKPLSNQTTVNSVLIVLVSIITLQATSYLQVYYSKQILMEEANRRAESELQTTELEIANVAAKVETAVRNTMWNVARMVNRPDSLMAISRRLVTYNDVIFGSAIALTDRQLSPYAYLRDGELVCTNSLASESYDYKHKEWFVKPIELGKGYWSEPYYDEGGGQMLMTTYSVPVSDGTHVVAVLTADVSLAWLAEIVEDMDVYPNALSMLVSSTGKIIVSPNQALSMSQSILGLAQDAAPEDTAAYNEVNRALLSGKTGNTRVKTHGRENLVFYDAVESMGWSMSVIIPEDEIYGGVNRLSKIVFLLQLLGIIMILIIINHTIKSERKLHQVQESQNKIENELQVASDIQKSMLPKQFPPFPERQDIDVAAALVPAKEVGGDLYDYFFRNDVLYFCIGDVSGKGVPASLFMAVTRSLFRSLSSTESSPAAIVSRMNANLSESNDASMFVTFFCGVLDMQTGLLKFCNAGHNAPAHFTDKIQQMDVLPNIPLGVFPDFDFQEQEIYLHYDDALFLYTDGITEAENINHQLFGEERMLGVLRERRPASDQLDVLARAVVDFRGEAPQSDDITALFIHYLGHPTDRDREVKIVLKNDISQIPNLEGFMDEVASLTGIDRTTTLSLNLAIEEAVTNVMLYAYPQGKIGTVNLKAVIRPGSIEFVLWDRGIPFDPTAAPDADITLGVEERAIGGLGIHLVRNIMDSVSYQNRDGMNILTMIKNI